MRARECAEACADACVRVRHAVRGRAHRLALRYPHIQSTNVTPHVSAIGPLPSSLPMYSRFATWRPPSSSLSHTSKYLVGSL